MSIDDDIAFLERVPMLAQLGESALRILAIGTESYSVNEGETLFAPGERADCAEPIGRATANDPAVQRRDKRNEDRQGHRKIAIARE